MRDFVHTYEYIISLDNLLEAWREFLVNKRQRKDVQEFAYSLMSNICNLQEDLATGRYEHGPYQSFSISDPKLRHIHKALVRDRLVHHAVYRILYPYFDKKFTSDSFSCRIGKGTHKGLDRFRLFCWKVSKNNTQTCWVLKCDVRKFFASIDQIILIGILKEHILDQSILGLLNKIISSFYSTEPYKGLPLGNLTSQLLANIYMNKFDQWMKHQMKAKYYIRYADDFIVMSTDKIWLEELLPKIGDFLLEELKLELHPDKVHIRTLASGVDFLGWVHFPDHRVLRTTTKRRMIRNWSNSKNENSRRSYLGLLSHGNTFRIRKKLQV